MFTIARREMERALEIYESEEKSTKYRARVYGKWSLEYTQEPTEAKRYARAAFHQAIKVLDCQEGIDCLTRFLERY